MSVRRIAIGSCLVFGACLLLAPPSLAIDVEFIAITAGGLREDGALLDYFLSFSVDGADMAAVDVYKPGAPPTLICSLVEEDVDAWNCDLGGFADLDDICQNVGFGDFLFEFTAAVGSDDTVTLFFDPGCTDPISGYPAITAPASGGTVPPVPGPSDFCWDCSASGACGPGDYVASLYENGNTDLAVEVLRGESVPTCWDPGICLPTGLNHEFEVSALSIQTDFETTFTDLGDEFVYASAFESVNYTFFNVTDPPPTTPPAAPDGSGLTQPMRVGKLAADGSTLRLFWDVDSCCTIIDHHLVHGTGADLPASLGGVYALDGSVCDLGAAGAYDWFGVPDPGAGEFVWWLILVNDGSVTEGSWGLDGAGQERTGPGTGGVSAQCGMTTKDVTNACGR